MMSQTFTIEYDDEYDLANAVYSSGTMTATLHLSQISPQLARDIGSRLRENVSIDIVTSQCDGSEILKFNASTSLFTHVSDDYAENRGGSCEFTLDEPLRLHMATTFLKFAERQAIAQTKPPEPARSDSAIADMSTMTVRTLSKTR